MVAAPFGVASTSTMATTSVMRWRWFCGGVFGRVLGSVAVTGQQLAGAIAEEGQATNADCKTEHPEQPQRCDQRRTHLRPQRR